MARFQAHAPTGSLVQELEVLVRTAIFKPANALVGHLLQGAADRIDAAYQPSYYGRFRTVIPTQIGQQYEINSDTIPK